MHRLLSQLPLAALAVLLLLSAPLQGQEQPRPPSHVTLAGRVTDSRTGAPVAGAAVRIPELRRATVTDSAGRFAFSRVRPGEHRVVVSRIGYAGSTQNVTAGAGGAPLELAITSEPLVLDRIAVITDWLEQRRRGIAMRVRAVHAGEIQGSGASRVTSVVRRYASVVRCPASDEFMPGSRGGTRVWPRPQAQDFTFLGGSDCVYVRGRARPVSVAIDEIPATGLDELDSYAPQDIHLIEVYQGGLMVRAYTTDYVERLARRHLPLQPVAP